MKKLADSIFMYMFCWQRRYWPNGDEIIRIYVLLFINFLMLYGLIERILDFVGYRIDSSFHNPFTILYIITCLGLYIYWYFELVKSKKYEIIYKEKHFHGKTALVKGFVLSLLCVIFSLATNLLSWYMNSSIH